MKALSYVALQFRPAASAAWLLSVLLAAIVSPVFAQGSLTGTVTNAATGATLEGARVVLKGTGLETTSDGQGVYRFENAPPGSAVVSVSYTGLSVTDMAVVVSATAPTRRDVGLTADIYKLESFVVSSEREERADNRDSGVG